MAHGLRCGREGADIVDVGGESTRPGAEPVVLAEGSAARALPVIEALSGAASGARISIDTSKVAVAREARSTPARAWSTT